MEELRSEDLEELMQELEEESGALETLTDEVAAESAQQQPSLLAPSELVLLLGDQFAKTSSAAVKPGEWVRLVHMDTSAEARELGETMLAAAFLAVEQVRAVQLEVRRQQALFGLLNRDKLYVVPGEHAISWPIYSLESQLRWIAANLQSQGDNHVSEIIYDWWMRRRPRKSGLPWRVLGDLVFDGLVSRGLL